MGKRGQDGRPRDLVEAILWDNDGVLVETEHLYFEATRSVLDSAGISLSQQQYVELFLVQGRGAWHLAEERGASPSDVDRLRDERNTLYARLLVEGPRLVSGIASVLETLHDGFVMGVVTSSRKDHFDLIHRSTGLLKYFDFVLTGDDYARTKPHPDPYLLAIERAGVAGGPVWRSRIPKGASLRPPEPASAVSSCLPP